MTSSSIEQIENLLKDYIPLVSKYGADGKSINRMDAILSLVDNPQERLKVIHIAGTSGKSSTAYYLSALLVASGKKVGLTVSPHIYSITERVQIDNKGVDSEVFLNELTLFLKKIEKSEVKPSYFELMMSFAIWEFVRQGVDYAVIETGMGGLLDASNILKREDKVCVITDIGFDHIHVLGDTIKEISSQKAGIIHKNNTTIMYEQSKDVMESIEQRVLVKNAKLHTVIPSNTKIATLSQFTSYQMRNFELARKTYEYLAYRDNLKKNAQLKAQQVKIPGRMEAYQLKDSSTLILDGAHNKQKVEAFVSSFSNMYPDSKAVILLALKQGKEYRDIVDTLITIAEKIIITKFETSDSMPATSMKPEEIKNYIDSFTDIKSDIVVDKKTATEKLVKDKAKLKIVTGSFYLISQIKTVLNNYL